MPRHMFSSTLRSVAAITCVLTMAVALTACSNGSDSSGSDAKNTSSSSSSSVDMDQIAGIRATGKLGQKPNISFKTPMTVQNNTYAVLQKGDGATVEKGDRVCAQGIAINVKDGSELMSTWEKNTPECSILLSASNLKQIEPYNAIVGQKLNASIAFGVNDSNSSGTSYILVYTLVSKSKDLTRATGDKVTDVPIKGKGAEITDSNTAVVKYTGWLTDGTQFDSSWDKNTTFDADVSSSGQIIQGWKDGLIGQTVGSQVLLVIPPDKGYGDQKSGSIPANSTLVFVIDILAAY